MDEIPPTHAFHPITQQKNCVIVSFLVAKIQLSFPSPPPPPPTGGREKGKGSWIFAARKLTINKHYLRSLHQIYNEKYYSCWSAENGSLSNKLLFTNIIVVLNRLLAIVYWNIIGLKLNQTRDGTHFCLKIDISF